MLPVVAIVGRTNVGKSTLFNRLTKSDDALMADEPNITRDRLYGYSEFNDRSFIVIDTGGIVALSSAIDYLIVKQSQLAIQEADIILLVVDAKNGRHPDDELIAKQLRLTNKKVLVVVNKTEGVDSNFVKSEFYYLGFSQLIAVAARLKRGIKKLMATILDNLAQASLPSSAKLSGLSVAIIGRPNVGKSTLVNRLIGKERVLVYDMPGTTRDCIAIPFCYQNRDYTLIDTPGVQRRVNITQYERYAVIKTLQVLHKAQAVIFMIDACDNISEQDLRLLGLVLKARCCVVIAVNKWDNLVNDQKNFVKSQLHRRLPFAAFVPMRFISALHGSAVGELLPLVDRCYALASKTFATSQITMLLRRAVTLHQPPVVNGRRIKLRYAHLGSNHPFIIVIYGNQVNKLPASYRRYLEKFYRQSLKLMGTPITIKLQSSNNPFDKG